MIARVFGRIDGGIEVDFKREGSSYILEFPKKLNSGNYIVEVYAEDTAGNVGYYSTLLCTIDPSGACIHLSPVRFFLCREDESIVLQPIKGQMYLEAIPPQKCRGDG